MNWTRFRHGLGTIGMAVAGVAAALATVTDTLKEISPLLGPKAIAVGMALGTISAAVHRIDVAVNKPKPPVVP